MEVVRRHNKQIGENKAEKGATMVEYALAVALLALVLLMGIPSTETKIQERVQEGREIWTEWNFELS